MQFEEDVFSQKSNTKILALNDKQSNEFRDFTLLKLREYVTPPVLIRIGPIMNQ